MAKPRLLIDHTLLTGTVNVVPEPWLDGFDVRTYRSGQIDSAGGLLGSCEAILLRTVTRLEPRHVRAAPRLRAVATLSSGTDHVCSGFLKQRGIAFFTGRGGNAIAVADWVQWALARALAIELGSGGLAQKRVIVVGCGAVGTAVAERLEAWGAQTVQVDPPRGRRERGFASTDLDDAIEAGADAVTLHVPLTDAGPDATRHLLNGARIAGLTGAVVLQSARGGVMDEIAACDARAAGNLRWLAIDTFADEPHPSSAVLGTCDLVTPHIAGHSIEGKLRVAGWPLEKMRALFGLPTAVDVHAEIDVSRSAAQTTTTLLADPLAALDRTANDFAADPTSFRKHRAAHWRMELPTPTAVYNR